MNSNGKNGSPPVGPKEITPRRLVLLKDGEASDVERVLAEYRGAEAKSVDLHAELHRFAAEHKGQNVAGEWECRLGWVRFLWCRRPCSD